MGRQLRPDPFAFEDPQAGFSLIELLVVVAVLAVLAVGVTLTPLARNAPSDMARFREMFEGTRALAIAGREIRGLEITPQHMARSRLDVQEDGGQEAGGRDSGRPGRGEQIWVPGRVQPWRGPVTFLRRGASAGAVGPGAPQIRFLPDGRTEAFAITFGAEGRCESDGWTGVTCHES